MLELEQIVGIGHVAASFILSIYFIWAPKSFDIYYLLYFFLLNISWSLLKNECAASYLFKLIKNPNYKLGTTSDVEDYNAVLGPSLSNSFLKYILAMYVVNILFIASRYSKDIHDTLFILLAGIAYILYITMLRKADETQQEILQSVNLFINSILLGYFLYK